MVVVDGQGIPLGSQLTSASPAEVKLAEATLDAISVPRAGRGRPQKRPLRVIADRAYDSDPPALALAQAGLALDCSASQKPPCAFAQRRTHPAPLPQTLEGRAHLCLAGQLPPL